VLINLIILNKRKGMTTHLIDIGNSKVLSIPDDLIEKYQLGDEIEIKPANGGIFISKKRKVREGWQKQIRKAIATGDEPDKDPLENTRNEWDKSEWTWPE
jgi:antitoxin component of MazEF toxin-antitoxin module